MKPDQIPREKAQEKLNDWKSFAETLNVLLHLEAREIKNEFENQKKNLRIWLESVNDSLQRVKDLSEDEAQKLKSSLENLRVQAALGKAETEDSLKEQQQNISNAIQQLQMNMKEVYNSSKEKMGNYAGEVPDKLDDFHTCFDLFRLQLHLGKEEAKEDWEKKKKEITNALQTINDKIENGYEDRAENWDRFSNEMSKAWQHIKQGFTV